MSELWKILLGIAAFISGQAILQFVFQPIKEFNKERGDTCYLLLFYQAQITNATKDESAYNELREMGAALISTMTQIPLYSLLSFLGIFGLPLKRNVLEACRELNGIVYSLRPTAERGQSASQNLTALKTIGHLLKIKTSYSYR